MLSRCCLWHNLAPAVLILVIVFTRVHSGPRYSSRIVDIQAGAIRGIILELNSRHLEPVEVFRGVPYAAPPVGPLRFKSPQPPLSWPGTRLADSFGAVCPQRFPDITNRTAALQHMPKGRYQYLKKLIPLLANQSEDCLFLNIYVPGSGDSESENSTPVRTRRPTIIESDSEISNEPDYYADILGINPSVSKPKGIPLSTDLGDRWTSYLRQGLKSEDREQLRSKWVIPETCSSLNAPKLNPEVQAMMSELEVIKDSFMCHIQTDMGAGLSALGVALDFLINESKTNVKIKENVLPGFVDATKLLCNAHFQLSMHRRHQVYPKLKSDMQKLSRELKIEDMLFGENLVEKYKAVQSINKSMAELKASSKKKNFTNLPSTSKQYLNSQRPIRRTRFKMQNFVRGPKTSRTREPKNRWDENRQNNSKWNPTYNQKY